MSINRINLKTRSTLIIFIIFIIAMIIFGFLDIFNNLNNKKYYRYSEVNGEYLEKVISNSFIRQDVIPKTNKLECYSILYKSNNYVLGKINLKIKNSNNNDIFNKVYNFSDIVTQERLNFNLDNIVLNKGEKYTFEFTFNLNNNIVVYVDSSNNIKSEQILQFNNISILKQFLLIIFIIILVLILFINLKKNIKIHTIYLAVSLIVGLSAIILSPPFTAPDEARHFYRAYDIAQGNFISKEFDSKLNIPIAYLPKEISRLKDVGIKKDSSIYVEYSYPVILESLLDEVVTKPTGEKSQFSLKATASINPIAYLPQVIFIKIGMILKFSPLLILYMARLGNLLLWILTIYISIKFIPKFKLLFFVIAMIPEVTLLASSCSTDSFLMSVVISFITYLFYLKYEKRNLYSRRNIVVMILTSILLASIKLPYILILLLSLLVSYEDGLQKKNVIMTICSIIIGLVFYKVWNFIGCKTYGYNVGNEYILFVIKNPIKFIQLIILNLKDNSIPYITQIFSGSMWNYSINGLLAISYFMVFIIVGISSSNFKIITNKFDKTIIIFILFIVFALICFVSFTWQSPYFGELWGIQGRYFIPLVPLIGIILSSNKDGSEEESIVPYVSNYLVWTISSTIFNLINCNFLA